MAAKNLAAPMLCPHCGYLNHPTKEHIQEMIEHGMVNCDNCSKSFIPETEGV